MPADTRKLREKALRRGDHKLSLAVYPYLVKAHRFLSSRWLKTVSVVGAQHLETQGPVVIAATHRSHFDPGVIAENSSRRIRALGKESLFRVPGLSLLFAALGAFPVRRGEADREALAAALKILKRGEIMIVFPEGTRQTGREVAECFDGPVWLASRSNAKIIPMAIYGTEYALPSGAKWPSKTKVAVSIGAPVEVVAQGSKLSREEIPGVTADIRSQMQEHLDLAVKAVEASDPG